MCGEKDWGAFTKFQVGKAACDALEWNFGVVFSSIYQSYWSANDEILDIFLVMMVVQKASQIKMIECDGHFATFWSLEQHFFGKSLNPNFWACAIVHWRRFRGMGVRFQRKESFYGPPWILYQMWIKIEQNHENIHALSEFQSSCKCLLLLLPNITIIVLLHFLLIVMITFISM